MDKKRIIGIVAVAFLLALAAGIGTYRFLSEKGRVAEAAKLQTMGIAVAVVDIPLGSTINPNQVALSPWPKDLHLKDAFSALKPVIGRVAIRDFLRGEPIVESKLVPANKNNSGLLSLKVPAGMRAFSVKVNEVVGVGGFIVPDSRVDVVVTTAVSPQRQQEQVSKTFLQDVQVLAVGQIVEQKDNKPVTVNTVTIAVTPADAEKLALASNDGKIQLVLRNFSDAAKVETPGSDKGGLIGTMRHQARPAAPRTAAKRTKAEKKAPVQVVDSSYMVEVIRAGKRSEERVD